MMNAVVRKLACAAFASLLLSPLSAVADQAFPDKPVKIVVPFSAGGPTDIFARLVAQKLSDKFRQQVVIDNRPGAGGNIGTQAVTKSDPDGHTLLFASASIAIAPSLYGRLPFDPMKDLQAISLLGVVPMILITHAQGPTDLKSLAETIRAKPGHYTYASAGNGSATHLGGEAFKAHSKLDVVHVPYKGTAPALVDVIAGRHLMIFDYFGPVQQHVAEGRLRILGIASEKRSSLMPKVPTFDQAGFKDFTSSTWNMLFAPAGTPKPVVQKLSAALSGVMNDPEVVQKLTDLGIETVSDSNPEKARAFLEREVKRWAKVVESSGAKLD